MLAVAAQNSPRTNAETAASEQEISQWIATLPVREKDEMLVRAMNDEPSGIGMELQSRFRQQRDKSQSLVQAKPRTVAELLSAAEAFGEERKERERKKAAEARARKEKQAAIAREEHLDSLKGRSDTIWTTVGTLIVTRLPKSYDEVGRHLIDLRDLAEREGRQSGFKKRLDELRKEHAAKKSLIDRLVKRGL